MQELYTTALAFPAVIYTALLGFVLFYWLLVILGAFDIDILGDSDLDGLFSSAAFVGVPISISLSFFVLIAWALCMPATYILRLLTPEGIIQILIGAVILALCFWPALLLTAPLIRPLRTFFKTRNAPSHTDLVGKLCTISTLEVNEKFGQATYEDGGAGLIIQARSDSPNKLAKNSKALIIAYDRQTSAYQVVEYNGD